MTLFKATIEVLVEADCEAEACDAISEALRPLLKTYAEHPEWTSWIDWRYANARSHPKIDDGSKFERAPEVTQ